MRSSPIWKIPKDELIAIVKRSKTLKAIGIEIGFINSGGGWCKTLKRRLAEDNIDYSHISLGRSANRGKTYYIPDPLPLNKLLIENCPHSRGALKRAILRYKLIEYKCAMCGLGSEWHNKPLTLRLDHKNGVNNDNRIENLRFLCPNCDSQTDTWGGRNQKKKYNCFKCGRKITKESKTGMCRSCCAKRQALSSPIPGKEELGQMVWESPATHIAKRFGVSNKAVANWCVKYGLDKPGPGYWSKLNRKQAVPVSL